jgi:hypothetical protein
MNPRFAPLGVLVGCSRHGEHRRQVKLIEPGLSSSGEFAEGAIVQHLQSFADCGVCFGQAEEGPMTQSCQDEALDDLNADFDFRLVFRTTDTGGQCGFLKRQDDHLIKT